MSLGISGAIAKAFQNNAITPLLAILGLLLGFFAILVTPKEEEPQIAVTFANIYIGFPGASAKEVEQLISTPAERVLSEITGVDDIYSVSRPGQSVLTVAFEVGLPRDQAILNLYNKIYSNADWLPFDLGVSQPLIKPLGIDDVPIMSLTLWSESLDVTQLELTQMAQVLEVELKRIDGTRNIYTQGGQHSEVSVLLDPVRLNAYGMTVEDIHQALLSGNAITTTGALIRNGQWFQVQAGDFLSQANEIEQLIVGLYEWEGRPSPVYLADVAEVRHGLAVSSAQVFHRTDSTERTVPAVTLAIAKQPGKNAFDITEAVKHRLEQLRGKLIPDSIQIDVTRNFGDTAKEKSDKLIAKLLFATLAVVILVLITMSWREALIVGAAIFITLAITLFASWAWGFTLNRISLFALIFSIGILVDDAIVVVENIHRHLHQSQKPLNEVIPVAVEEVGGPTILATFTVIAALMPMAFVSGLMGPYMSPIPINASTGMLISLMIAFVVTPWLSFNLLTRGNETHSEEATKKNDNSLIYRIFDNLIRPLIQGRSAKRNRWLVLTFVVFLIFGAIALPGTGLVVLKMLPFDNKSEFQVVLDMPEGTQMEDTLVVLEAMGLYLQQIPEVNDYQLYAGTHAPINFNGLIRQYYLRQQPHHGDIQVNLVAKKERDKKSHQVALQVRPTLQEIARKYNGNAKVVEVPPGPPVMSPIVAEVYGSSYKQQIQTAKALRAVFESTEGVVDIDDSIETDQNRLTFYIDRQKASIRKVPYQTIVSTMEALLNDLNASYLHDDSQHYATPIRLKLEEGIKASTQSWLHMKVRSLDGHLIPLTELVTVQESKIEKTIYHKNLQPVVFVNSDMAGQWDSPLYGLFEMSGSLREKEIDQYFISSPDFSFSPSIKWDGEWQITYETFRDMGIAYGVGMILIYLLVVAQFRSYLVPLIIMAPIPLTIIGVMPGHSLLGAQFTATSMIGMIALAGIIVRNSILLVDFINQELSKGVDLVEAAIHSAAVRTKPILLTGIAAMTGAFFILDDPIFSGLAISLISGILISTLFTLILIPMLYYVYQNKAQ